jgi:hypothetical protein
MIYGAVDSVLQRDERAFTSEDDASRYFLDIVLRDPTARCRAEANASFRNLGASEHNGSGNREIGARQTDPEGEYPAPARREIGAPQTESAEETCSVRCFGPAEVVQLFQGGPLHGSPQNRVTLCAFRSGPLTRFGASA